MNIAQSPGDLLGAEEIFRLGGMAVMQGMLEGRYAHPAISQTMGMHLHSVEEGRVAFRGSAGFRHTNPMGGVHGGWYATLLDSALGCAVMTRVPVGFAYTTLELKVNITRALPVGVEVEAVGVLQHAGRTTAVASAELRGTDGRLYATGSTTCIIMQA